MINYYHHLLSAIATTLAALYLSLKGKPKNLKCGHLKEAAFCNKKNALPTAAALNFLVPNTPFLFSTIDSGVTIDAVLEQMFNGSPHRLAYFTRKLSRAECCYPNFDCELLAVHLAVRYFCQFLEGIPFVIRMEHMLLLKKSNAWSSCQC
ncbi:uncharacterized protein [Palaemon carinicauda]|uniref:uncharacterized protein n=1 Tax=Palaemon carinicauda TaxID=392227 RepID=UPI0035B5AA82